MKGNSNEYLNANILMRTIPNPEKFKKSEIVYKNHRVIIPVYIPSSNDEYFLSLFDVFKSSVNSLLNTINIDNSAITIINNYCKPEVTQYIDNLLKANKIDKHVKLSENYGKVHVILSEAKGCYEEYITIADADVFYLNNWEQEVFKIFESFNNIGVVSPVPSPHLFNYNNKSLLIKNVFKLKKANIVSRKSFSLFSAGVNNDPNFFNKSGIDFRKNQYYLEKNNTLACIGAVHFIATYKKHIFNKIELNKPRFKFKAGDENLFIDSWFDKLGYGRLSTKNTYAYHLGHSIPEWTKVYKFKKLNNLEFVKPKKKLIRIMFPYIFIKIFYKIIKKIKLIKGI